MGLCCTTIEQSTIGLVEGCGKYDRLARPGLICLNPCTESVTGRVSLRVQQLEVRVETKTQDNVFVTVVIAVQYHVIPDRVYDAYYKLSNPHSQIQAYVFDAVRSFVPKLPLDGVFESKEDIANAVKQELSKTMDGYGYFIVQALVIDIEPDITVKRAMNEINAAQRLRVAATDKAEAEKILRVKQAEAEAESKFLSGQGIARARKAIVEGLRDSVTEFTEAVPGSKSTDVMDLILMTQYFDALKDIGSNSKATTIFIPHSPGNVSDIQGQLRTSFLSSMAASQSLQHNE
jgi:regulator of protease activity HflC (stomatin/prohibitin superfamily)